MIKPSAVAIYWVTALARLHPVPQNPTVVSNRRSNNPVSDRIDPGAGVRIDAGTDHFLGKTDKRK